MKTLGIRFGGALAALGLGASCAQAQIIDHSHPAAGNDDVVANQSYPWGPMFLGGVCRLTDKGSSETGSFYSRERVDITQFQNSFEFQILSGGPGDPSDGTGNCADGMTFVIQNAGLDALGAEGGSLGYGGIPRSVAVKFDTVPNPGDPSISSTGLFINGTTPEGGIDLLPDGVNLRSQHKMRVDMKYNGRALWVRLADEETGAASVRTYAVDIPQIVGGRTAFVGFTAATGLGTACHDLHKWYFASLGYHSRLSPRPDAPTLRSARRSLPTGRGVTVAAWPTNTIAARKSASLPAVSRLRAAR